MDFYAAHKRLDPNGHETLQSVKDHLDGTAALASCFAAAFGAESHGNLAGLAHDIGKYSDGFQKRLQGGPRVDHATAGALECSAIDAPLAALCVAGHHSGLPDFGSLADMAGDSTLIGRLKKMLPMRGTAYPGWQGSLPDTPKEPDIGQGFYTSLWCRMLYSCLVDADYLDTEHFMQEGVTLRGDYDSLGVLWDRLSCHFTKWKVANTPLNQLRHSVLEDCICAASQEKGLFSLTVPTGGGKTLSSLAFALHHAVLHHCDIHMLVSIPPHLSVSQFVGYLKGKSSLMIFDRHANLKYKYGNRHFWRRGYYVDTVGKNKRIIAEYIRNQLEEDYAADQISLKEYMDPFTGSKNK